MTLLQRMLKCNDGETTGAQSRKAETRKTKSTNRCELTAGFRCRRLKILSRQGATHARRMSCCTIDARSPYVALIGERLWGDKKPKTHASRMSRCWAPVRSVYNAPAKQTGLSQVRRANKGNEVHFYHDERVFLWRCSEHWPGCGTR